MLNKEDLAAIGEVVNKRFETERIHTAQTVTQIVTKAVGEAKEELKNEIEISRAEAKADSLRILGKLDKQNSRITNLEEVTKTPNPHKN